MARPMRRNAINPAVARSANLSRPTPDVRRDDGLGLLRETLPPLGVAEFGNLGCPLLTVREAPPRRTALLFGSNITFTPSNFLVYTKAFSGYCFLATHRVARTFRVN